MRKTIAAVTVGLLLVAGQAAALNTQTAARVGDRVGARADTASEFQGVASGFTFVRWVILPVVGLTAIFVATQDGGDS